MEFPVLRSIAGRSNSRSDQTSADIKNWIKQQKINTSSAGVTCSSGKGDISEWKSDSFYRELKSTKFGRREDIHSLDDSHETELYQTPVLVNTSASADSLRMAKPRAKSEENSKTRKAQKLEKDKETCKSSKRNETANSPIGPSEIDELKSWTTSPIRKSLTEITEAKVSTKESKKHKITVDTMAPKGGKPSKEGPPGDGRVAKSKGSSDKPSTGTGKSKNSGKKNENISSVGQSSTKSKKSLKKMQSVQSSSSSGKLKGKTQQLQTSKGLENGSKKGMVKTNSGQARLSASGKSSKTNDIKPTVKDVKTVPSSTSKRKIMDRTMKPLPEIHVMEAPGSKKRDKIAHKIMNKGGGLGSGSGKSEPDSPRKSGKNQVNEDYLGVNGSVYAMLASLQEDNVMLKISHAELNGEINKLAELIKAAREDNKVSEAKSSSEQKQCDNAEKDNKGVAVPLAETNEAEIRRQSELNEISDNIREQFMRYVNEKDREDKSFEDLKQDLMSICNLEGNEKLRKNPRTSSVIEQTTTTPGLVKPRSVSLADESCKTSKTRHTKDNWQNTSQDLPVALQSIDIEANTYGLQDFGSKGQDEKKVASPESKKVKRKVKRSSVNGGGKISLSKTENTETSENTPHKNEVKKMNQSVASTKSSESSKSSTVPKTKT